MRRILAFLTLLVLAVAAPTLAPTDPFASAKSARSTLLKVLTARSADVYKQPLAVDSPGANVFPLLPDANGDFTDSARIGIQWAQASNRPVTFVSVPGRDPVFKTPLLIDQTDARYLLDVSFRLPWYGIAYEGPPLTHAVTLKNAKGCRVRGLGLTLMRNMVGGVQVMGASTSANVLDGEGAMIRVASDRTGCVCITLGGGDSNDVCNNVVVNYRLEAQAKGNNDHDILKSLIDSGNRGIQIVGANNLGERIDNTSISGFRFGVSTSGWADWNMVPGGGASTLTNVGGSWCAEFIRVFQGFTFNHWGGRIEKCGTYVTVGEPNYGGDAPSSFNAQGVYCDGMMPYWNREMGLGLPDGSIVKAHCPGSYALDLTVFFSDPPAGMSRPDRPLSLGSSSDGTVSVSLGGNLATFAPRLIGGAAKVDGAKVAPHEGLNSGRSQSRTAR